MCPNAVNSGTPFPAMAYDSIGRRVGAWRTSTEVPPCSPLRGPRDMMDSAMEDEGGDDEPRRVHDDPSARGRRNSLSLSRTPFPPLSYKGERMGPYTGDRTQRLHQALVEPIALLDTQTHTPSLERGTAGAPFSSTPAAAPTRRRLSSSTLAHARDLGHPSFSQSFVKPYCKPVQETRAATNWT